MSPVAFRHCPGSRSWVKVLPVAGTHSGAGMSSNLCLNPGDWLPASHLGSLGIPPSISKSQPKMFLTWPSVCLSCSLAPGHQGHGCGQGLAKWMDCSHSKGTDNI